MDSGNFNNYTDSDKDGANFKEVFAIIFKYKYSILFITALITFLAFAYAYYKPNIYRAVTTLEITANNANNNDILSAAVSKGAQNNAMETEIIKSRFITNQVLNKVDFAKRYFAINKFYKKIELYKKSPFDIKVKKGYGILFKISPISDEKCLLTVDKNNKKWSYSQEVKYGEWIKNNHFEIKIDKIKKPLYKKYLFVDVFSKYLADDVRSRLKVSFVSSNAGVMVVSFEDNIPSRAQKYVNEVAKVYLKQSIEYKTKEATKKLNFINKQLAFIKKNLQSSAKSLEDFKRNTNSINLSAKANMTIERSAKLETQLEDLLLKKQVVATLYKQVKNGIGLENISIVGIGEDTNSLMGMVKQLQNAIIQKRMLLQDFTPAYPEVVKVNSKIRELKKSIIFSIRNILKMLVEKEKLIRKSIAQEKKLILKLPQNERILTNLKRKYLVNEKIYSYLLEKRSEVEIIKASTISQNRIIDKALLPRYPIKPKRKFIIAIGFVLGLFLGLVLAFVRSFLNSKIESKEDVEKETKVPIISLLPHIYKDSEGFVVFKDSQSALAESYRAFRKKIQSAANKKSGYAVGITSTISKEGISTVSVNLASIISLSGKRVIIVDTNMRKPKLHKKFNLPNSKGLSTFLMNKDSLFEVIQKGGFKNIDVITSGICPSNPNELLESEKFKELIDNLRKMYDVIIFDTPPIGLVTDADTVLNLSDVSLYIVREKYSKKEFLELVNSLKNEGLDNLYIVYNDAKAVKKGYGYNYSNGQDYY